MCLQGRIATAKVKDETSRRSLMVPVFGIATGVEGKVAVYGDSNCVDSAHLVSPCSWLLEQVLSLLTSSADELQTKEKQSALAKVGPKWSSLPREQAEAGEPPEREPERTAIFAQHSHFYASSAIGKEALAATGKGRRQQEETGTAGMPPGLPRTLPLLQ